MCQRLSAAGFMFGGIPQPYEDILFLTLLALCVVAIALLVVLLVLMIGDLRRAWRAWRLSRRRGSPQLD